MRSDHDNSSRCRWLVLALLAALVSPGLASATSDAGATAEQASATASRDGIRAVQGPFEAMLFYVFAAATVVSALGVVISKSVVRMATWLFFSFGMIAVLYFLLQAHFLAAVQLIVYVGGILVLIVFGIMLTGTSPWLRFDVKPSEIAISGVACGALAGVIGYVLCTTQWPAASQTVDNIRIDDLGKALLTDYLVPFELAAVLLMIVMIGAAYLARQPQK